MNKYAVFAVLFLLASGVSAHDLAVGTFDYNTGDAIRYANVSAYNGTTLIASDLTGADGYANITLSAGVYTLTARANGYYGVNDAHNVTDDGIRQLFLSPYSTEGIIKVVFSDASGTIGDVCFFYDNMRLRECVDLDNTSGYVRLMQDRTFYVYPKLGPLSGFMGLEGTIRKLASYGWFIFLLLVGIVGLWIIWEAVK